MIKEKVSLKINHSCNGGFVVSVTYPYDTNDDKTYMNGDYTFTSVEEVSKFVKNVLEGNNTEFKGEKPIKKLYEEWHGDRPQPLYPNPNTTPMCWDVGADVSGCNEVLL